MGLSALNIGYFLAVALRSHLFLSPFCSMAIIAINEHQYTWQAKHFVCIMGCIQVSLHSLGLSTIGSLLFEISK